MTSNIDTGGLGNYWVPPSKPNEKLIDGAVTTIFNHLNGREDIIFSVLTSSEVCRHGHSAEAIKRIIDSKTWIVKAEIRKILEHLFGEAPPVEDTEK